MARKVQWHPLAITGPKSSHIWVLNHLSLQDTEDEEGAPGDGWEQLDPTNPNLLHFHFLTIISQFADTRRVLHSDDQRNTFIWVRTEDIDHARQYPVILAFQTMQEISFPVSSHPLVGEIGLVLGEDSFVNLYTLDMLDKKGETVCQQLQTYINLLQTGELTPAGSEDIWQQARQSAKALAAQYWGLHRTTTTPALRRELPTMYISGSSALVSATLPILAAYSSAYSGAQRWEKVHDLPTFTYTKDAGVTTIQIHPYDNALLEESTLESLWEQMLKLTDLDGDVLLLLLYYVITTNPDEKGFYKIRGADILRHRGIKPKTHKGKEGTKRTAGQRREDFQKIAECIERMKSQYITVRQWLGEDEINTEEREDSSKKKRRKASSKRLFIQVEDSPLILVRNTTYQYQQQQFNLIGNTISAPQEQDDMRSPVAISWKFQFGSWIDPFLQRPNQQIAERLLHALDYDPYHETWEKRLARYFTFHMRMNAYGGGVVMQCQIGTLLSDLGLTVDYRNPEKTTRRFNKAMKCLLDKGDIDAWKIIEDLAQLPARKWITVWLTYNIQVYAAPLPRGVGDDGLSSPPIASPS